MPVALCIQILQRVRAGSQYVLHPCYLQAARPYCSPPPSSPAACMQANSSGDWDKIIPRKEARRQDSFLAKPALFFPLSFIAPSVPAIRLEKYGTAQACVQSFSATGAERCVDGEHFLCVPKIHISFISFFHSSSDGSGAAACRLRCALASI